MIRRLTIASLLAAIAFAALGVSAAQSEPLGDETRIYKKTEWKSDNVYLVRATLDGRKLPNDSRSGGKIDFLKAGEWVGIECQVMRFDEDLNPVRVYDRVNKKGDGKGAYYVPDQFIRTYYTGLIPDVDVCKQ